jgi:hypothetical protein
MAPAARLTEHRGATSSDGRLRCRRLVVLFGCCAIAASAAAPLATGTKRLGEGTPADEMVPAFDVGLPRGYADYSPLNEIAADDSASDTG